MSYNASAGAGGTSWRGCGLSTPFRSKLVLQEPDNRINYCLPPEFAGHRFGGFESAMLPKFSGWRATSADVEVATGARAFCYTAPDRLQDSVKTTIRS